MSVPACPIPTQNTKFVMSHAQPTGTLRPQMPIPSQKSHETATPRRPRSAREGRKKSHQPIGVRRSTGSATTSVIDVEVRRAQDERGTASDRVVEQFCFRLRQRAPSLGVTLSGSFYHECRGSQASASARTLVRRAPSRRDREADLLEQRLEVVSRGRNRGDDPRPGLPNPRVRARKRAHLAAGAEEPLPRLVRLGRELLEKRRRSPRALDPRSCAPPARALPPAPSSCCARRPEPPGARRPRRARRLLCRSSARGVTRTSRASTSKSASAAPSTREPSRQSAARAAPSMPRVPRRA